MAQTPPPVNNIGVPTQANPGESLFGDLKNMGSTYLNQVKQNAQQSIQYANQGAAVGNDPTASPLDRAEGGLKTLSGAAGLISSPFAPAINSTLGRGITAASDKISDIPAIQKFAMTPAGVNTERIAGDVGDVANVVGTAAGIDAIHPSVVSALSKTSVGLKGLNAFVRQGADWENFKTQYPTAAAQVESTVKSGKAVVDAPGKAAGAIKDKVTPGKSSFKDVYGEHAAGSKVLSGSLAENTVTTKKGGTVTPLDTIEKYKAQPRVVSTSGGGHALDFTGVKEEATAASKAASKAVDARAAAIKTPILKKEAMADALRQAGRDTEITRTASAPGVKAQIAKIFTDYGIKSDKITAAKANELRKGANTESQSYFTSKKSAQTSGTIPKDVSDRAHAFRIIGDVLRERLVKLDPKLEDDLTTHRYHGAANRYATKAHLSHVGLGTLGRITSRVGGVVAGGLAGSLVGQPIAGAVAGELGAGKLESIFTKRKYENVQKGTPPKGSGAATPKTAETLTSELKPATQGARIKQALQNYLENTQMGLSTKDVTEGGQKFNVGLTSVKGKLPTIGDALVKEGQALYDKKDFTGAQEKFNAALKEGADTITNAFSNTGIKVKPKGVGLGVYQDSFEPNYDLTATVPKGKEDLFHYILSDIADKNFHQHSVLTYRQTHADAPLGVTDASKGGSTEPYVRFNLEKPLSAEDIHLIGSMATKNGVHALSVREGGKAIDIINLSKYNTDYEGFVKNGHNFWEDLQRNGVSGSVEQGVAEARFIGGNPDEGHGSVSYDAFRNKFRSENPGFFNTEEGFTSKVIDRLKNKESVTPAEVDQITKSQDITPLERGVVLDALGDKTATRIPVKDLVASIEGKSLPVSVKETDQYANYGLDAVGLSRYTEEGSTGNARTLVFETPVEHGVQGHFGSPNHLGHTRIYIEQEENPHNATAVKADLEHQTDLLFKNYTKKYGKDFRTENDTALNKYVEEKAALKKTAQENTQKGGRKIGYITEIQSDVAQKASPEDLMGRMLHESTSKQRDEVIRQYENKRGALEAEIAQKFPYPQVKDDTARTNPYDEGVQKLREERDAALQKIHDEAKAKIDPQQQQFLHLMKNDRYQDTLLRGTLQHLKEQGVDTVRVATPSSIAKIEGYINEDETAPYNYMSGDRVTSNDADLTPGDEIEYIGDSHTVVDSDRYSITVAPTDKVNSFSLNDHISDEQNYRWNDEARPELEKIADKNGIITPEVASKILKGEDSSNSYYTEKALNEVVRMDEPTKVEDLQDIVDEVVADEDHISNLEDSYGNGNVFVHNGTVFTVEGDTEGLQQPSEYSGSMSSDNADAIDPVHPGRDEGVKREIDSNFDKTHATVLKGYVDLYNKNLQKISKEENVPIEYVTGKHDSTWYEFPLTDVKRKLFGN